jgi:predicted membrane protein
MNSSGSSFHDKKHSHRGGRFIGFFIIVLGLGMLARRMQLEWLPYWVFSWPVVLILLGIFLGIKHRFRKFLPVLMIGLGTIALLHKFFILPENVHLYLWPGFIILTGIYLVFKPAGDTEQHTFDCAKKRNGTGESINEDTIEITDVFCGTKKNILSKSFKGGEITTILGGTELNLSRADIENAVILDLTVVLAGIKIIIPNNWDIRTNLLNVAAGVEDKRPTQALSEQPEKTLVLEGTVLFGGITILNY